MADIPAEPAAGERPPSVDPALTALIDLEQRTRKRRLSRLAHVPLAALRELEQRTGSPPATFGGPRPAS